MRKFFRLGLVAACCVSAAEIGPPAGGLTVHEWGTFTSIANETGNPVQWLPLAGPPDLPCFVHHLDGRNFKGIVMGTVRMETPVLYFYAAHPLTATVKVNFPRGMITEWYPQAKAPPTSSGSSAIEWNSIALSSAARELPRENAPSHYYAARQTDALMVESSGEHDRMLFYRGLGTFEIPLHPRVMTDGKVRVEDPQAIVFENRGDGGNRDAVKKELEAALIDSGLYPKEAHAMVETWRDSWFEEGLRVFYIVPREKIDAVLPLAISPRPEKMVRTFVGRIELLAPWMRDEIATALQNGDLKTLARRGRFLNGFLEQMKGYPRDTTVDGWVQQKMIEGASQGLSGCGSSQ